MLSSCPALKKRSVAPSQRKLFSHGPEVGSVPQRLNSSGGSRSPRGAWYFPQQGHGAADGRWQSSAIPDGVQHLSGSDPRCCTQ